MIVTLTGMSNGVYCHFSMRRHMFKMKTVPLVSTCLPHPSFARAVYRNRLLSNLQRHYYLLVSYTISFQIMKKKEELCFFPLILKFCAECVKGSENMSIM